MEPAASEIWYEECVSPGRKSLLKMSGPWIVDVVEATKLGDQRIRIGHFTEFGRGLIVDDQIQLLEAVDSTYTSALIFPAAIASTSRRRWLILGGGDGAAAREALSFSDTESVTMIDLSRDIPRLTQEHIPSFWQGCQHDPRLNIVNEDAFQALGAIDAADRPNIIVFDLTDPEPSTSAPLYSSEAFGLAASCLAPDGVFVCQLQELGATQYEAHVDKVRVLRRHFKHVHSYRVFIEAFGYYQSFVIATNRAANWRLVPSMGIERFLETGYVGDWRSKWGTPFHQHCFNLPPTIRAALDAVTQPHGTESTDGADFTDLRSFTEVRESAVSGLGLFATRRIPKGTVWWTAGSDNVINVSQAQYQHLLNSELSRSAESRAFLHAIQMYGYINEETNEVVVAVDNSRFVNHADEPTSVCSAEDPNNQAVAAVDILPGDEITEDYRTYSMDTWNMPDEPYLTSPAD